MNSDTEHDLIKTIVFADSAQINQIFEDKKYDVKLLPLLKVKIGLSFQDVGLIN